MDLVAVTVPDLIPSFINFPTSFPSSNIHYQNGCLKRPTGNLRAYMEVSKNIFLHFFLTIACTAYLFGMVRSVVGWEIGWGICIFLASYNSRAYTCDFQQSPIRTLVGPRSLSFTRWLHHVPSVHALLCLCRMCTWNAGSIRSPVKSNDWKLHHPSKVWHHLQIWPPRSFV